MSGHRHPDQDRRLERRTVSPRIRARMRPGYRLSVIDVNSRGVLVEAGRPLRPGSHVDVHLETDARRGSVPARVLRCTVAAIDSTSGVIYRAALCFSESCEWLREPPTPEGYGVPASGSNVSKTMGVGGERIPRQPEDEVRLRVRGTK